MITIIIAFLAVVAVIFLLHQLIRSYPNNNVLRALRDLLTVTLALAITVAIIFIGFRLLRFIL
ncbi:MAG: hypothetical protein VW146_02310 [Gammaproteobacteria bacterium]